MLVITLTSLLGSGLDKSLIASDMLLMEWTALNHNLDIRNPLFINVHKVREGESYNETSSH